MVDQTISPEVTEKIISSCDLPSNGVYTNVGTYDCKEIFQLVSALSSETGVTPPKLVHSFGVYLFGRFVENFDCFFTDKPNAFLFLESVDDVVHIEVRKLYPNAELPSITCERVSDDKLILVYKSMRHMGDLAQGLIEACIDHFGDKISLKRENISDGVEQLIRFDLTREI